MIKFTARQFGHQPKLTIEANSIKQLLTSSFFIIYTHDKIFSVGVDGNKVILKHSSDDSFSGVIGFIKYD